MWPDFRLKKCAYGSECSATVLAAFTLALPVNRVVREPLLSFSERLQEIRIGFERPFWVANISEIFERLSYYAAFASLALYLQERLNFSA